MNPNTTSPRSHVRSLLTTIGLLGFALAILVNRQYLLDQVNVWQFTPSAEVQSLAEQSTMSSKGEFYFYASRPVVQERDDFNTECNAHPEDTSTAILGCYTAQRIYVYNVTDKRLDGIKSVTAAHEMLHAAYDRLSSNERTRIDGLIEAEYGKLKDDKKLASRMAFYDKTEPGERDNELHSVIGTEVAAISPELETYYSTYFTRRSDVVSLHSNYEAVFTSLQTQADELSSQLAKLNDKITTDSKNYNDDANQLDKDIQAFNSKATGGGFSSQTEFNAARSVLLSRSSVLNSLRSSINSDITTYESLRKQLEAVSLQSEDLNKSINSNLAPAPSV